MSTEWRCFHCGKAFTEAEDAELHFGPTVHSQPACQIPDGLGHLRALEARVAELEADQAEANRRFPTWARNVRMEPLLKQAVEQIRLLLDSPYDHVEVARNFVATIESAFCWRK